MRFAWLFLVGLTACSHQPGSLRDTTGTVWSWSCSATACSGAPTADAGAPACHFAYGSSGSRVFLLCSGPIDDAGTWTLDPLTCRPAVCFRDSDCPTIGGGRVLQCTGGLCEDHDQFPSPSSPEEAAALCLADVPRPAPCADVGADPATQAAVSVIDGGCAAPCVLPVSCRQP